MIQWIFYAMVYLGSALMAYNIYGFICFTRFIRKMKTWNQGSLILSIPVMLLVFFLLGYIAIGLFAEPSIFVGSVLFGGSIFVFVMYKLLNNIVQRVVESEHLEAQLLAAEESSRAKSSFLASISHEMRTPMNVILGLDTLAMNTPGLPRTTKEQLEKIGHSARHLSELINGILDMQQIESGEMKINSEPFLLMEALEQVNALASSACEEKGLAYCFSFDDCAEQRYDGDVTQLKRAIMCLMDNAVKYTDAPGTVKFIVSGASAQETTRQLHFTVLDTGVGIDEAFLEKVFEPFAQEDESYTNRFGGSGMGLTVANGIVTHMGGRIDVVSHKGEGSAFTITIPMELSHPDAPPAEAGAKQDGDGDADSLEGRRVLIVEDTPENAEIVADLLELEGAQSEHAENGMVAIKMVTESEKWHYDAILMDLRMPVMDGIEAARNIRALEREDARHVPIIALTANAFDSDIQHSREAGMNEHLVKPVEADRLYAVLRKWIRSEIAGRGVWT